MKKIIITGALGQIGTELVIKCRERYGTENVLATDIRKPEPHSPVKDGPFEILDVINTLEAARRYQLKFFTPSSIGAFGISTPKVNTPQLTIQQPTTMYGINKVTGELLCQYYYVKFGVDTRSVRFPGLISHVKEPGGGTTDYAVDMYFKAVKKGHYTSYINRYTYMDMMYMEDAIDAIIKLMEEDSVKLKTRNGYNLSAMSIEPEMLKQAIQVYYPDFTLDYDIDLERQDIALSWPDSIDTSCAEDEWGFDPKYDLPTMTKVMLEAIEKKQKEC